MKCEYVHKHLFLSFHEKITNFYNFLRYEVNPWLNYTLQLHRMREMGFQNRLFDFLDERALTLDELHQFCGLIFGEDRFDGIPNPEVNLKDFCKALKTIMKDEEKQRHPIKRIMKDLVSVDKIKRVYGDNDGCSIM